MRKLILFSNLNTYGLTFRITFSAVKNNFILYADMMITLLKDLVIWIFSFIPKVNLYRSSKTTSRKAKILKHVLKIYYNIILYIMNLFYRKWRVGIVPNPKFPSQSPFKKYFY